MSKENINPWINNFRRQIGIRRGIILHGDIMDICFNGNSYAPILDTVSNTLHRRGFNKVVIWDRFSGIENISSSDWKSMVDEATSNLTSEDDGAENDYDMGDENVDQVINANESDKAILPPSADDFLTVVYYHMLNRKSKSNIAFVIDWSQYLFGNANALSEQERKWLIILSKAIRNAPINMDSSDYWSPDEKFKRPANIVVLLCQNLGSIPPSLYKNNPSINEIIVPLPGRLEREKFLKSSYDQWLLDPLLKPGTVDFNDFIDSLEGMSLTDLQQLIRLSRQTEKILSHEQLINLYRYGELTSPWEDLNKSKLNTIRENLKDRVFGQDEAIEKVSNVIIRAFTGLSGLQHSKKQKMPKGSLFFVGPTGVGKTELAKSLANFLFGDEDSCIRFDMSEFNHEHSDQRLIGAPPGYVGYEEGGQLTNSVKKRPFSVLLFDEIEKAHVRILDKFLQILEDGRLTDGKGETVYFSETVIIFTSNIGVSEIEVSNDKNNIRTQFIEKVREHFVSVAKRPELLNRIGDNIVPFNFITDDDFLVNIARTKLHPLRERLKDKYRISDLEFKNEDKALRAIAKSVDQQMGGRGILNQLVKCIINPLAEFLFYSESDFTYYIDRTIEVIQVGDTAKFEFKVKS